MPDNNITKAYKPLHANELNFIQNETSMPEGSPNSQQSIGIIYLDVRGLPATTSAIRFANRKGAVTNMMAPV